MSTNDKSIFVRPLWVSIFALTAAVAWGWAYPLIKLGFIEFHPPRPLRPQDSVCRHSLLHLGSDYPGSSTCRQQELRDKAFRRLVVHPALHPAQYHHPLHMLLHRPFLRTWSAFGHTQLAERVLCSHPGMSVLQERQDDHTQTHGLYDWFRWHSCTQHRR